ncbi:SPW repeat domain-containing protein [Methylobacterium symbioticum]|uniref:SPW repeat domain-containing protein n=2 Tax=Methylobacterium TaxID=407 RepID=UPI0034D1B590
MFSGCLGLMLTTTPWVLNEAVDALVVWNRVFGGALVIRLGFSAAIAFRAWKARGQAVVGAWLLAAPWLFAWGGRSATSCAHVVVGAAAVVLAAAGLRRGKARRISPHDHSCRAAQPC